MKGKILKDCSEQKVSCSIEFKQNPKIILDIYCWIFIREYVNHTALFTINLDRIAWQPCNPAVGGPAKSQLVHEVDALGGIIGQLADETAIQKRCRKLVQCFTKYFFRF